MTRTPTVDAHQHFWDPARADYPWMTDDVAAIRRRFGPEDLRPLLAERGVDCTVLVQTRSSLEETREYLDTAARNDFVAGVVGWVDLTDPAVGRALRGLRSSAGGAKLVFPSLSVCEHTARQFGGDSSDDYSLNGHSNLAWNAMLRLVERLYPDYKD